MTAPRATLHVGDAISVLRTMATESVQCVVTSPPYWGLRDYGVAGQIGLEGTPTEYVERLVGVFREVRRVLAVDGTLWLNLGDCFATGAGKVGRCPGCGDQGAGWAARGAMKEPNGLPIAGLKPKDLVGIPWRVAFALQADGWWLRQDIIWAKPNPMPESVKDRPTKAHEYLFLLAKSERYRYDAKAAEEPVVGRTLHGVADPVSDVPGNPPHRGSRNAVKSRKRNVGGRSDGLVRSCPWDGTRPTRNRRSVWVIATQPFAGAHFAVMPEALVEPCIAAGSRPGELVLDPFGGSMTVVAVALRMGRSAIGIDLRAEYVDLGRRRIEPYMSPLFEREEASCQ